MKYALKSGGKVIDTFATLEEAERHAQENWDAVHAHKWTSEVEIVWYDFKGQDLQGNDASMRMGFPSIGGTAFNMSYYAIVESDGDDIPAT